MDKKEGLVYTYLMRDGNICKIGKSKTPQKRLQAIKTSRPNLELICFGRNVSELHMHKKCRKYNIGGEWFKLPHKLFFIVAEEIASKNQKNYIKYLKRIQWSENKKKEARKKKREDIENSRVKYEDYILDFGPYRGIKLINMVDEKQKRFLHSCIQNARNKNSYRQKAIRWWVDRLRELERIQELKKIT